MSRTSDDRVSVELGGAAETLLWTLYQRAGEARRGDAVLDDPRAPELVERIDYPFADRFGSVGGMWSQWQALRALTFDRHIRRFLAAHPDGTVVALGEGLETTFWRVDNGSAHWITVDLPEAVDVRQTLLPPESDRQRLIPSSVTEQGWLDQIAAKGRVLLTAQGLLMYLKPVDVHRLLAACAARFPGGAMLFDAVPGWLAERSRRGELTMGSGYQAPIWTWGMDGEERRMIESIPGIADLRSLRFPRGRGLVLGFALPALERMPGLSLTPITVMRAGFGS